jgi:hypothetical protein
MPANGHMGHASASASDAIIEMFVNVCLALFLHASQALQMPDILPSLSGSGSAW